MIHVKAAQQVKSEHILVERTYKTAQNDAMHIMRTMMSSNCYLPTYLYFSLNGNFWSIILMFIRAIFLSQQLFFSLYHTHSFSYTLLSACSPSLFLSLPLPSLSPYLPSVPPSVHPSSLYTVTSPSLFLLISPSYLLSRFPSLSNLCLSLFISPYSHIDSTEEPETRSDGLSFPTSQVSHISLLHPLPLWLLLFPSRQPTTWSC